MSITSIMRRADELLSKSADARQVLAQRFKEVAAGRSSVPNNEVEQAAPAAVLALKQIMDREGLCWRHVLMHRRACTRCLLV